MLVLPVQLVLLGQQELLEQRAQLAPPALLVMLVLPVPLAQLGRQELLVP
jgi:hypothetical protein